MSQGEMYFALHKFLLRTAGTGGADAPAGAVAVAGQVCSERLCYLLAGSANPCALRHGCAQGSLAFLTHVGTKRLPHHRDIPCENNGHHGCL